MELGETGLYLNKHIQAKNKAIDICKGCLKSVGIREGKRGSVRRGTWLRRLAGTELEPRWRSGIWIGHKGSSREKEQQKQRSKGRNQ